MPTFLKTAVKRYLRTKGLSLVSEVRWSSSSSTTKIRGPCGNRLRTTRQFSGVMYSGDRSRQTVR